MSREDTRASPFAALYERERRHSDRGGNPKIQVQARNSRLGLGERRGGGRSFHSGHYFAGSRINNIVKASFVKNDSNAGSHISRHADYIENREREKDEPERKFYSHDEERSRDDVVRTIMDNRGDAAAMFKIILSPKQNELNLVAYTREIFRRFEEKTRIVTDWSFVQHRNTQYHHVHIVMPGRDQNGDSFRLGKDDLNLFREIANEYQYELQDRDYKYEKQVEHEFGLTRDEANLLIESARDRRDMKDIGLLRPEIDRLVQNGLIPSANFSPTDFTRQQEERGTEYELERKYDRAEGEPPVERGRLPGEVSLLVSLASKLESMIKEEQSREIEPTFSNNGPDGGDSWDDFSRAGSDPTHQQTAGFTDFFMGGAHPQQDDAVPDMTQDNAGDPSSLTSGDSAAVRYTDEGKDREKDSDDR